MGGDRKPCWAGKGSRTPTSTSLTPPRPSPSTVDPYPVDKETEARRGDRWSLGLSWRQVGMGRWGELVKVTNKYQGPLSREVPFRDLDTTARPRRKKGACQGTSGIQDPAGHMQLPGQSPKVWPVPQGRARQALESTGPSLPRPAGARGKAAGSEPWVPACEVGDQAVAVTGGHLTRGCAHSWRRRCGRRFQHRLRGGPRNRPSSLT